MMAQLNQIWRQPLFEGILSKNISEKAWYQRIAMNLDARGLEVTIALQKMACYLYHFYDQKIQIILDNTAILSEENAWLLRKSILETIDAGYVEPNNLPMDALLPPNAGFSFKSAMPGSAFFCTPKNLPGKERLLNGEESNKLPDKKSAEIVKRAHPPYF